MNTKTKLLSVFSALAIAATVGAGCGDEEDEGTTGAGTAGASTTGNTETASNAVSSDTPAAGLRADLTALLTEHVELAGIAVVQGVQNGLDSEQFDLAAAALDTNSEDLAAAVGSVYGDAAGDQFLELWRAHIGFFVDYAAGKATGDEQKAEAALADLDTYRQDFGAFIESATEGGLSKMAVADELEPHVASLAKAIDSVVAGEASAYADLQEAASHMPSTAAALAGAIATQNGIEGDAASPASELRASLTYLLDQHVYAATIAVATGLTAEEGLESAEFMAAADALDANSVALGDAIGSVYGDAGGDQFLELWRAHIGFFVDYTAAKASGDKAAAEKAKAELDGYREDFGAFIESATEGALSKDAVADELGPHVESVLTVIDDAVEGNGELFTHLREAAAHMPGTAEVLAGAIAGQFPDKFGG